MAGMKVQVVEVDKDGSIDVAHLKAMVQDYTICKTYFSLWLYLYGKTFSFTLVTEHMEHTGHIVFL